MITHPLGRRQAYDPKDALHPMAAVLTQSPEALEITYRYWSGTATHLDQTGSTCVANAWTHFLSDSPRSHRLSDLDAGNPAWAAALRTVLAGYTSPQSGEHAFRGWLYDQAQQLDEFADTPPAGGTSVRAGAKVLQSLGAIKSYHWAANIDDVITAVLTEGPVIVGTNWYHDMFRPVGSDARLHPTGGVAGGHAWKVDGYNRSTLLFRMKNSWGLGWALKGYAHITQADLSRLLFDEPGEACIALEP